MVIAQGLGMLQNQPVQVRMNLFDRKIQISTNYGPFLNRPKALENVCWYIFNSNLKNVLNSPALSAILNGGAGAGKSRAINAIEHLARILNITDRVLICAPTGLAASSFKTGATIDASFFTYTNDLPSSPSMSEYFRTPIPGKKYRIFQPINPIIPHILFLAVFHISYHKIPRGPGCLVWVAKPAGSQYV